MPRLLISLAMDSTPPIDYGTLTTNIAHNLVFDSAFETLRLIMSANHCFHLFGLERAPTRTGNAEGAIGSLSTVGATDPTPTPPLITKVKRLNYVRDVAADYKPAVYSSRDNLVRYLRTEILINNSSLKLTDTDTEALALGLGFVMHASFSSSCPVKQLADENKSWELKISRAIKGTRCASIRAERGKPNHPLRGVLESSGRLDRPGSDHDPLCGNEWSSDEQVESLNREILHTLMGDEVLDESESATRRPLYKSIETLGKNKAIHVIQADKGGATIIIDTDDYDREAHRQLSDTKTYTELTENEFTEGLRLTAVTVLEIACQLLREGNISHTEYETFTSKLATLNGSYIYFLPKIHKEWNELMNSFPGRPIAATFACVVNTLDKYITELTKPLLAIIPGSLRDTPDLLNKLPKGALPKRARWVTSDVNSLYPCIPWSGGIEAATAFYADNIKFLREHNRRNGLLPPPSVQTFCDAITTVLTRSFISFKGKRFFQQASGTSMGSCISVYLANAYMFQLTRHLIPHKNFTAPQRPAWLILFQRYIDDLVLIIDECTTQQLNDLFTGISNETIGYTTTDPEITTPALDVQLSINQSTFEIETEPYSKPTSKTTLLHARSTHPGHSIDSLPYAQYIRLLRIASTREAFERHAARLTEALLLRDYPIGVIRKALEKARLKKREDLLSRSSDTTTKKVGPSIAASFKYIAKFKDSVTWNIARHLLKLAHKAAIRYYKQRKEASHSPEKSTAKGESAQAAQLLLTKPSAFVYSVHNSTRAMLTRNYKRPRDVDDETKIQKRKKE